MVGFASLAKLKFLLFQKKLAPSVFKIGCSQAGKNKWVEMGKHVSRKVMLFCSQLVTFCLSAMWFLMFCFRYSLLFLFATSLFGFLLQNLCHMQSHSVYSIALNYFILGSTCGRQSERAAFTNTRREGLCHVIFSIEFVLCICLFIMLLVSLSPLQEIEKDSITSLKARKLIAPQ